MNPISYINVGVSVNYCSTSLDGKYMAAVCDNTNIILFDLSSNNYSQITKINGNFFLK
jgi:hypothetical protein